METPELPTTNPGVQNPSFQVSLFGPRYFQAIQLSFINASFPSNPASNLGRRYHLESDKQKSQSRRV